MNINRIAPNFAVSPQIQPGDVAAVAAAGFAGIVNNRPDGEAPDQPSSAEIAAEAARLGLDYWYIPVPPGRPTEAHARAFDEALGQADGPLLGFCRTGNRSAALWELAGKPA